MSDIHKLSNLYVIDLEKVFWVDEKYGDDSNAGTIDHPFKTAHHACIVGKGHTIVFLPEKSKVKQGGPLGDGDYYPSHEKIMRNNPAR